MVLGLTGGVGAGKSTVAQILKTEYDAVIILSDDVAKELMLPGNESYVKVIGHFGDKILTDDKRIDNKLLADIVFNDARQLEWLNRTTHPIVIRRINEMIDLYKAEGINLIVLESALLAKAGCNELCDCIWFVSTGVDKRIRRLEENRGYERERSMSVIDSQGSDEWYISVSDDIICNDGDIAALRDRIKAGIEKLKL